MSRDIIFSSVARLEFDDHQHDENDAGEKKTDAVDHQAAVGVAVVPADGGPITDHPQL